MKNLILFLFFTLIIFIQLSIAPRISFLGALPNIILLIVICWLIMDETKRAFLWSFLFGLLVDIYSGGYFGAVALSLLLTIGGMFLVKNRLISSNDLYSRIGIVAISTFLFGLINIGIISVYNFFISQQILNIDVKIIYLIILEIIFNIILFLFLYPLCKKYEEFLQKLEIRIKAKNI